MLLWLKRECTWITFATWFAHLYVYVYRWSINMCIVYSYSKASRVSNTQDCRHAIPVWLECRPVKTTTRLLLSNRDESNAASFSKRNGAEGTWLLNMTRMFSTYICMCKGTSFPDTKNCNTCCEIAKPHFNVYQYSSYQRNPNLQS